MFSKLFHKNRRRNSEPVAVPPITLIHPQSDHRGRQRMIDTSPLSLYGAPSMDHGYETGTSVETSRRSSFGVRELPLPARRRYTMQSRFQMSRNNGEVVHKTSYQMQPTTVEHDEDLKPVQLNKRRMSVPENVFRRCEFAIMRPIRMFTNESSFEIVSAFDRHSDPYQTFMKSFTCYDVQPTHSPIIVFDGRTKVRTAVNALSQQGNLAAIVSNTDNNSTESVLNMSDCLVAILMVVSGDKEVAQKSLFTFLKDIGSSKLICSGIDKSVWEASRIMTLNHLNCIPIFDTIMPKPATPLFFLTAKLVLQEVVLKLSDVGEAVLMHVRQATLEQKKIGMWKEVTKINQNCTIEEAIKLFVDKKYSTIPVINDFDRLVGLVSRKDIISEIMGHQVGSYLAVLRQPIKNLPTMKTRPVCAHSSLTIYETLLRMTSTDKQCIPVVNEKMNILAIISYGDILSYIQSNPSNSNNQASTDNSTSTSNNIK